MSASRFAPTDEYVTLAIGVSGELLWSAATLVFDKLKVPAPALQSLRPSYASRCDKRLAPGHPRQRFLVGENESEAQHGRTVAGYDGSFQCSTIVKNDVSSGDILETRVGGFG